MSLRSVRSVWKISSDENCVRHHLLHHHVRKITDSSSHYNNFDDMQVESLFYLCYQEKYDSRVP